MNPLNGEEAIFDEALRLPPEERAAWLAQAIHGNAELRQRVEVLLGNYEAGTFLEHAAAPELRQTRDLTVPLTEKPGDTIGRYKLLQQIGEGGCGVVYMAEQLEPVRRRVALKIIKLGMDTKSVIARFEAERQAVALMDHPNIAKVFDAGATETGRPYFVMELVRGMKITEYCDEAKLSTRARLDLFVQVCQAIQHAHQKGIIHRDIKPSNILVTVNNPGSPGVPKIIDFGIAKATTGQQLTDKTVFTAFEQFIGTPAYMSPEQALFTNLDIDTRSDIYALGVLLYELLTGKTPFDATELLAIGLDEMRRTICEQEPPRPSTRLSTLSGHELSTTAQRRGLDAPRLVSELRGDLDWIVMKTLEKDRARRYETASGLANDIQRHLNNESVVACPPSPAYRFQKMVRRNRFAFAAGSAVAVALLIGLTLATVFFFRERAARKRADEQGAIAQAVNDFLQQDMLRQASSSFQADAHFTPDPNLTVRQALERAAERIGDRFKDQPLQEAAVRYAIGNALTSVGEAERGIVQLELSVELARAKLGPDHPNTLSSMSSLAGAYLEAGKLSRALALAEETLKLRKARFGSEDRQTLGAMNNLASAYYQAGKLDQALTLGEETLKLMKARLRPGDPFTFNAMSNLAERYRAAGKLGEAIALAEETLKLRKAMLAPDHPSALQSMNNLVLAYRDAGRFDQALRLAQETLKLTQLALAPDHPAALDSMNTLALAYRDAGNLDEALSLWKEALRLARARFAPDDRQTLKSINNLARAYRDAGRLDQAFPLCEEALKLARARFAPDDPTTLEAMEYLADAYNRSGKAAQALPLWQERLKLTSAKLGPDNLDTLRWTYHLAETLATLGKLTEAEALFRDALERLRPASSAAPPREVPLLGVILHHLALVLLDQKKLSEARPFAEDAIILYRRHANWPLRERRHALDIFEDILKGLGDMPALSAMRPERMEILRASADKNDGDAANSLSWLLATAADAALRDGRKAVQYAEQAIELQGKNWLIVDTLAAAYAEAGDFAKAADAQREAIHGCPDEKMKKDLEARLRLYESNSPFRE